MILSLTFYGRKYIIFCVVLGDKMNKKIFTIIYVFIFILLSILIVGSFFIRNQFPSVSFDELYFYLTNGVTNSDGNVFIDAIKSCLPFFIVLMIVFYTLSTEVILENFIQFSLLGGKSLQSRRCKV